MVQIPSEANNPFASQEIPLLFFLDSKGSLLCSQYLAIGNLFWARYLVHIATSYFSDPF
jgi:hypothetical protein